jgi:hypothetical protein
MKPAQGACGCLEHVHGHESTPGLVEDPVRNSYELVVAELPVRERPLDPQRPAAEGTS